MSSNRVMPFEIHNYAHNDQWLVTDLSHVGRVKEAIAVARNLVEQPRDPQKNGKNDGGSSQRSGRQRWMEVLVRYELWDDLIEATTSGAWTGRMCLLRGGSGLIRWGWRMRRRVIGRI